MKQNSIFSYVKRNNNSSEGVDGNGAMYFKCKRRLIHSGPNEFQLSKLENGTTHIWDTGSFCEILNVAHTFQKCRNNRVITFLAFLTSVISVYLLKCLITKYLIFLQVIRVFKFLLMGVPW